MVSEINPNVKAYYAYKAINYLGGEPAEKEFSIIGSAKDSTKSVLPVFALMEAPRAIGFMRGATFAEGAKGLKGVKAGYSTLYSKLGEEAARAGIEKTTFKNLRSVFSKSGLQQSAKNYEAVDKVINGTKAAKETGKIGKFFGKYLGKGGLDLGTKITSIPKIGPKLGQFGKACSKGGAGFMIAIDGAIETFTNIIPAFKNGGAKEGMKQVGKSAVKVGASAAGFVGGAKAGAAIGAAIGSVLPGAGTAIGGFIGGLIGGIFGSSVAGGVAKKITGKSYSEKAAEEQKQQMAQQMAQDPTSMQMLQSEILQKLAAKQQAGQALTTEEQELLQNLQTNQGSTTTYKMPNGEYDYRTSAFKTNKTESFDAVA